MTHSRREILGVLDIGGSHVTAGLVAVSGSDDDDIARAARVVDRLDRVVDASAARVDLLEVLTTPALELGASASIRGWTVALPGPFDYEAGGGTFDGVGKFASIAGVDLRAAFADRLAVKPSEVRFVNDAAAYGIGEWAFGAVGRPARMLCITLGTGVGSAFLDEGRYVTEGPEVPDQGAAHTLTFEGRPLEATVSSLALRRRFLDETGESATVQRICERARAGDASAMRVIAEGMAALGGVLAPWLHRFRATRLVVGGAIARSFDVLQDPLVEAIDEARVSGAEPLAISAARLGDEAPLLGAAHWRLTT